MKRLVAPTIATILLATHPFAAAPAQDPAAAGRRSLSLGIGIPESIDLHGGFGAAAGAVPDYEGSDDYAATVLPLVDINQPGFLFLKGAGVNPDDGLASLGWRALNLDYSTASGQRLRLAVGPLVRYSGGRDEDDSESLRGLGDIDGGVGVGGFLEAGAGPWSADVTVVPRNAGGGNEGLLVAFGARYTAPLGDHLTVSAGLSAGWADDDYMQGFFGVTDTQAARGGLRRFDAGAGFKDVGVEVGASYAMSRHWSLDGRLGYRRLLGDAADSPLVDARGSAHQFRALAGVTYRF